MQHTDNIRLIMHDFAETTGLSDPSREPHRYLWTDAFAVCNFLELYRQTDDQQYLQLAVKLVDQVHLVLGKHHPHGARQGWLSGLDDEQALLHPTCAGLRIGKQLNERQLDEAFDDYLEWDRDGQYFHYLTKWMHALNRVSQVTGTKTYNRWACELAKKAHAAFTYSTASGDRRMYWKMSIDLSRPQVDSMGQHDPLDGSITFLQLETTAKQQSTTTPELNLEAEIKDLTDMCVAGNWATSDPLGIGGLLCDAHKLLQLISIHQIPGGARLDALLHDIERSMQAYVSHNQLNLPAEHRLAFRELGLVIGLETINRMQANIKKHHEKLPDSAQLSSSLNRLEHFNQIKDIIENFWLQAEHQMANSWLEHADINRVMLATSMAPDGFLGPVDSI